MPNQYTARLTIGSVHAFHQIEKDEEITPTEMAAVDLRVVAMLTDALRADEVRLWADKAPLNRSDSPNIPDTPEGVEE